MIRVRFKGLREFDKALKNFSENVVPEASLAFQKKIAIEILSRIIDKNPVGNPDLWKAPAPPGYVGGRSRANWQVSTNGTTDTALDAIDAAGDVTLAAGLGQMANAKPYGAIWIFNNVRYITALEDGHSSQAPAGMVGVTLAEIEAFFSRGA